MRPLRRVFSRIASSSWNELHCRLTQAAGRRVDRVRYGLSLGASVPIRKDSLSQPGNFLFPKSGIPDRLRLLRSYAPLTVEGILQDAEAICGHRFDLLGYSGLSYGQEIDWHLDIVHRRRASPSRPGYRVRYLDFEETGDHKVVWELNRHQHLVTLAKAWLLTGNPHYVSELADQWYSWQRANPYPLGINWVSSLEVAFRSLSWLWLLHLLSSCDTLPSSFPADLLHSLWVNGRHIERTLSTYFSPNTHLIGEAAALFFLGTLCPQLGPAERWKRNGWAILTREAERQVRPDGVHFEQAIYYHVYALDFFLHARVLAELNRVEIPPQFDNTLQRMLRVLEGVSQGGVTASYGDDDGGRVFDPRRNRVEHLTDPLVLGAILFPDQNIQAPAPATEESIWLFGSHALDVVKSTPGTVRSRAFDSGGIYVIGSEGACSQRVVIDAGPQGAGRCGHGHADALSLNMSINGDPLLIDPGTCAYVSDGPERDRFRGTRAHNTVCVDDLDQAVADGPFSWTSIPAVCAERWIEGTTFTYFAANHDGYCRLPEPVVHYRSVLHLHGGLWFVRDVLRGRGMHKLESSLHVPPHHTMWIDQQVAFVADPHGDTRLAIIAVEKPGWMTQLESTDVSPVYGRKERAPVLRIGSGLREMPDESAIVILPLPSPSDRPRRFRQLPATASGTVAYEYGDHEKRHLVIYSETTGDWRVGRWSCDAELLYMYAENTRILHLVLVGGSFLSIDGQRILSSGTKMGRFEWLRRSNRTHCSEKSTVAVLALDTIELSSEADAG